MRYQHIHTLEIFPCHLEQWDRMQHKPGSDQYRLYEIEKEIYHVYVITEMGRIIFRFRAEKSRAISLRKMNPSYYLVEKKLEDPIPSRGQIYTKDAAIQEDAPKQEKIKPETYTSLMNSAFESGTLPVWNKPKLFYDLSPKWNSYLEHLGNPIATQELFDKFIREYNQSIGFFLPARTPNRKPNIKKQTTAIIMAIINKIKVVAGLSTIKNIWVNKFIDVLFFVIGAFILGAVAYGLYRLTGHRVSNWF